MSIKKIFFSLLRAQLCAIPLSVDAQVVTEETLSQLYKIAKKHDLAHLVGDALNKNGLLPEDSPFKKTFLQERSLAMFRYGQQQYELEQICDCLEESGIPFLPLKGSVIRAFYPEPWMRTSCDIDVLVAEEHLDQAQTALQTKLGYSFVKKSNHDMSLASESGVHLELHYNLLEHNIKEAEKGVLSNIWEVVEREPGKNAHCRMTDEYFYCYHMSHLTKHLKGGGCGVRSILDVWILNHRVEFDKEKRDVLLQKIGLLPAARGIENLAEVWFSGAESDAMTETLGNYVLTGGVYGTFENKVTAHRTREKNHFSYLLSRVFIPYGELKFRYPTLQKHPMLYPFYLVKRFFLLLNKEKRSLALREVDKIANGKEEQAEVARLFKELEL